MPANPSSTSHSFGRTFIVAAAILAGVAVVQLGAVTWAFFSKPAVLLAKANAGGAPADEEKSPAPPQKIDVSNLPGAESPEPPLALSDPITESRSIAPPVASTPTPRPVAVPENPSAVASSPSSLTPPRPTPVPLSAFTPKQNPRFTELVEQGKLLRSTGDTAGALLKFREAALLDSGNPLPYAETAYTFEKMSLPDKAAEQWRQILAMGEAGGVYYSAAQAKLNMAIATTTRAVSPAASAPAAIPDGKTLAISPPRLEDEPDPGSAKKFTLHVPIRARAGQAISVRDMKVFVLFYEKLNARDIVRTAANVSNRWENPPDWAEGDETLEVSYNLPPSEGHGEPRAYYGYIIRLYYQGELQDTQAQPASLNQKFPAEYQLSD